MSNVLSLSGLCGRHADDDKALCVSEIACACIRARIRDCKIKRSRVAAGHKHYNRSPTGDTNTHTAQFKRLSGGAFTIHNGFMINSNSLSCASSRATRKSVTRAQTLRRPGPAPAKLSDRSVQVPGNRTQRRRGNPGLCRSPGGDRLRRLAHRGGLQSASPCPPGNRNARLRGPRT